MDTVALAKWRDAALILLSLEAFLEALAFGTALYFALRSVRRVQVWLTPRLLLARRYMQQAYDITVRAMSAVTGLCVGLRSTLSGLRGLLDVLCRR